MHRTMLILTGLLLGAQFLGCASDTTGGKPVIAVIPPGTTHEFWKAVHAGALTAADEFKVNIIWKGPLTENDRDAQIQIVETMLAARVDAIVLSPLDNRALMRPVRDAKTMGIPTVIFNSALAGNDYVSFAATDNYRGGVIAAEHLGALMGETGRLIMVRYAEGIEGTMQREEGFLDTISGRFSGIEIVSSNQYAGVTTESAYHTCENLLNRFGNIDGFFAPNESSAFGCLRAFQERSIAGEVLFVGFDSSEKLVEALGAGELHGLVLQDPVNMGYQGVRAAALHLTGEPVEKRIDTGVTLATPDNMNDPAVRALLSPDVSMLDM